MFEFASKIPSLSRSPYREIEKDDFNDDLDSKSSAHRPISRPWPWICSTVAFGLGFTILFTNQYIVPKSLNTFERGFKTELGTATHIIGLEKVEFTGNIRFRTNENGTGLESYLPHDAGLKQYAGKPSLEIDANWQELINDRYFWISDEEAASMWPGELDSLYHRAGKGYVAGLDVLHTLHCVDMMRMLLDPEHYPHALKMAQTHNYHCIDHLRQYLMCTGDLTPVPTKWLESQKKLYVDSDRPHTCRNFQNVLDWVKTREIVYSIHEL